MSSIVQVPINEVKIQDTVDSLNHPLASYLRDFLVREKRLKHDEIIIDDIENIEVALQNDIELTKLFLSGHALQIPQSFLNRLPPQLSLYAIAPRTCKKIFEKEKATRIFAIAKIPSISISLEKLSNTDRDIVVLDELTLSGNIGAIIRTSTAFNVGGLVVLNTNISDIYDRRTIRASRGYIFKIPIVTASLNELIEFCKKYDFKLVMMDSHAKKTIDQVAKLPDKMAIVFGSEKKGGSAAVMNRVDLQVKIPINTSVESLNVSVAASITLYLRDYYKRLSH